MSMFRKVCVCAYGKSYGPFYGLEGHGHKIGGERSPYERAELSHRAHCRCPGPRRAGGATPGIGVVQQQTLFRGSDVSAVFGREARGARAHADAAVLSWACRALVYRASGGGGTRAHDPVLARAPPRTADAFLGRGGVARAACALRGYAVNTWFTTARHPVRIFLTPVVHRCITPPSEVRHVGTDG